MVRMNYLVRTTYLVRISVVGFLENLSWRATWQAVSGLSPVIIITLVVREIEREIEK